MVRAVLGGGGYEAFDADGAERDVLQPGSHQNGVDALLIERVALEDGRADDALDAAGAVLDAERDVFSRVRHLGVLRDAIDGVAEPTLVVDGEVADAAINLRDGERGLGSH